jgi:phosphatidylinositol 4-kinase
MLSIFSKENVNIYLKPLKIITTGRGGIIQTLTNTISLFKLRSHNVNLINNPQNSRGENIILHYFINKFGTITDENYKNAIGKFIKSLVGYSLLCYFLEIKDRHNGNILIDEEGHLIHIDFGFLLSHSPGNMNFEKAPFKLTMEYIEIMEGVESDYFREFQELMFKGFMALRKNYKIILNFIEIYILTNADLPCFYYKETIIENFKTKLKLDKLIRESEIKEEINLLIFQALDNWRTKLYDNFQKYCVGIQ